MLKLFDVVLFCVILVCNMSWYVTIRINTKLAVMTSPLSFSLPSSYPGFLPPTSRLILHSPNSPSLLSSFFPSIHPFFPSSNPSSHPLSFPLSFPTLVSSLLRPTIPLSLTPFFSPSHTHTHTIHTHTHIPPHRLWSSLWLPRLPPHGSIHSKTTRRV